MRAKPVQGDMALLRGVLLKPHHPRETSKQAAPRRHSQASGCQGWEGETTDGQGFLSEVMEMFWNQTELMVAQHCGVPNATDL